GPGGREQAVADRPEASRPARHARPGIAADSGGRRPRAAASGPDDEQGAARQPPTHRRPGHRLVADQHAGVSVQSLSRFRLAFAASHATASDAANAKRRQTKKDCAGNWSNFRLISNISPRLLLEPLSF